MCHLTTHIGYAGIIGKRHLVFEHLKQVRGFNDEQAQIHIDNAFAVWRERNRDCWELDLSLITDNGIKLKRKFKAKQRASFAEQTLASLT